MIEYLSEKKYLFVFLWIGLKALLAVIHYRFYDIAALGCVSVWVPFTLGLFLLVCFFIAERRTDGAKTSTALCHLVLGLAFISIVCFLEI